MVNRKISNDLKELALRLWSTGWDREDICATLQVSKSSLYRWQDIFDELGTVQKPPSPLRGRPRLISQAVLDGLHAVLVDSPDTYLDELVWWLAYHHDVVISKSQLHANLKAAGLTWKLLHKIAAERDEAARAEFRTVVQTELAPDGTHLVCVDETSKNDHAYYRRHGRAPHGERAELKDVFVRGDRYSLVAGITVNGYIGVRVVPGSFDGLEFFDFIAESILPHMTPWPGPRSVLVLDNCRIHHNEALVELLNAAGCLILYLPPYSPDMNPIEESFSTLKQFIRRHGAILRQAEDPIAALLEACGCITAQMAVGWFRHAGYIF